VRVGLLGKVLSFGEGKRLKRLQELVPAINALEPEVKRLDDTALAAKTAEFRTRLDQGEDLDDILLEGFAVVREAAWRVLGQRHFDVQLIGGLALHFGWIAEMRTGEGKTLVSTLPVYVNALAGNGVHVVTVNDYLSSRDAEWMGRVHRFLGLEVGLVVPQMTLASERRAAYQADVTYGTNSEFGFDYLRDNMTMSLDAMVQRGHSYAIVDEVDSILIDEARTPLIISGPGAESAQLYYQFASICRTLRRDQDYEVDEEKRLVVPTEEGIAKVEAQLGVENLYDRVSINYVHHLTQALRAKELYQRDRDYIVADGEIRIVDEFTGRVLDGRRWSEGLHQSVEAKERVRIKEENHTWATITLQNYYRMYEKLAGMTGTAETEASEFASTYGLPVVVIPTNKPVRRIDQPDLIFKTEEAKFNAIVSEVQERNDRGQPVLIGTASVAKSEILSRLLDKAGIDHQVLNAKQHHREAAIVAQAGRRHAVTVATNMAGRGVDILLGGNPAGLVAQELASQGVDTTTEDGQRIAAELMSKYQAECEAEGAVVRELGGLYVIGSERHESRRIDNQLRGRAGRQGDPGESRFYLSLEDNLMRIFATGAVSWVMDRALPDDTPLEAKVLTKGMERAQATVEARNADIRKDVFKYDEVLNNQRNEIYARRSRILNGEDLSELAAELLSQAIDRVVDRHCPNDYPEDWNLEGMISDLHQYYPTAFVPDELSQASGRAQLAESLKAEALELYRARDEALGGPEVAREVERAIMLQIIDQRWREHLVEMDYLREGINLRAMGQQDPLVAWQKDGFEMFAQLSATIEDDFARYLLHVQLATPDASAEPDMAEAVYQGGDEESVASMPLPVESISPDDIPAAVMEPVSQPTVKADRDKIGRNDPCWCGSGVKFKRCHGA
jgi:preprotein translocase subunit SecA